jgi:hypothetical protein
LGYVGVLFGKSANEAAREPKFSELTREDSERLDRQRAVVAVAAKQRQWLLSLKTDFPSADRPK